MTKEIISTQKAPKAIGPYSQAVKANAVIYCSGQIPLDPAAMTNVEGGIAIQTRRVLENLSEVLAAGGSSLDRVVKTTVFLKDMNMFAEMNAVYGEFFKNEPPARATVEVARLPKGVLVEIEVVALCG